MTKAEEFQLILTRAEDRTIQPITGDVMVAGWARQHRNFVLRALRLLEAVERIPKNVQQEIDHCLYVAQHDDLRNALHEAAK